AIEDDLGNGRQADSYEQRAYQVRDRLPRRERSFVEGLYYADRAATVPRAVEAFKQTLAAYPDHDEAAENLAITYAFLGQFDEADRVLAGTITRRPADPEVALAIASVHLYRGHTAAALAALKNAPATAAQIAAELKQPWNAPPPDGSDLTAVDARLDAMVQAGPQHGVAALAYVRALFELAEIRDRQGDRAHARQLYARFAALWKDADVDRDRVAAAEKSGR
ncbi:MAG TPA: tetratricopeptide repeat protein, partial [Vicinamibacterales bacterium]|nr:tetratricopeptide repeat protein [Vicinamibacterales bacterium]